MILAIDQGTTGTTCLVVDKELAVRGRGYVRVAQTFPQPGWVEQDAEELVASVERAAELALADAEIGAGDLTAVGITNQRETTVLWERATGRPVAPAIVWQDRRTAERTSQLPAELLRRKTGLVPDPYFSATKLEWLLRETGRPQRGLAFGTVDSWLVWRLSGGARHVTDASNASRTLLVALDTLEWDDELLALFGVERTLLPEITRSAGALAEIEIGGIRLPVAGIAGDQQAALVGQAGLGAGDTKVTYGTGAFLLAHAGSSVAAAPDGLLLTAAAQLDATPAYAVEGAILSVGASLEWLCSGLGIAEAPAALEALAASVDSTDGVYFVPALTGLGSPHWDPEARGTLVGLTPGTSRAHVARAGLEAIAYQTRDVLERTQLPIETLRVDGGVTRNALAMQLVANICGIAVEVAAEREATALGAAALALIGSGVWSGPEELKARWRRAARFEPADDRGRSDELYAGWSAAVERAR